MVLQEANSASREVLMASSIGEILAFGIVNMTEKDTLASWQIFTSMHG